MDPGPGLTWGCSDDVDTFNLNQFHSSLRKVVEVILASRMAPKCETWACVWFWISLWGWLKFGSVLSCTAPSGHFEKWTCLWQAQPYPPSNVTFIHSLFIWVLFFMWLLPFWGNAHRKSRVTSEVKERDDCMGAMGVDGRDPTMLNGLIVPVSQERNWFSSLLNIRSSLWPLGGSRPVVWSQVNICHCPVPDFLFPASCTLLPCILFPASSWQIAMPQFLW